MRVIVKEPFQPYEIRKVKAKDFRQLVGGSIQYVSVTQDVDAIINEESKMNGSSANLKHNSLYYQDVFFGTVIFAKYDSKKRENVGMTYAEAQHLKLQLSILYEEVKETDVIDPDDYLKVVVEEIG